VPGAFELTAGAQIMFEKYHPDAVITLGCVIKGDTDHDKYINHAVSQGITMLSIQYKKPFIFGLLTPNTMKQALERSGGKHGNKGAEVAEACLKMIDLAHKLKKFMYLVDALSINRRGQSTDTYRYWYGK
jgi:6,7-dimethyl-8-ribityllumazine synthase